MNISNRVGTLVRHFAICVLLILASESVWAQVAQNEERGLGSTFARLESEAIRVVTEYEGVTLTAERTSIGGITAFSMENGKRSANLSVSPTGVLRVRIADSVGHRAILLGTATGVHGRSAAWANEELYLLLGEANGIDEPMTAILSRRGEFYALPQRVSTFHAMSSGHPTRAPRTVTTYFQDYVARSVTHPQGDLNSNVPAFTSSLKDSRSGERVGALRWFSIHEMLQWKIDGKPSTVLADDLPARWSFTPTPEWANVQLYSLARARENRLTNASSSKSLTMKPLDEEGCDLLHWLDETIFRACCDQHDRCYETTDPAGPCDVRSWWFAGSWQCVLCNVQAIVCFATLGSTAPDELRQLVDSWPDNQFDDADCSGGNWICPAYCYSCGVW